jgi:hypothetical protein
MKEEIVPGEIGGLTTRGIHFLSEFERGIGGRGLEQELRDLWRELNNVASGRKMKMRVVAKLHEAVA